MTRNRMLAAVAAVTMLASGCSSSPPPSAVQTSAPAPLVVAPATPPLTMGFLREMRLLFPGHSDALLFSVGHQICGLAEHESYAQMVRQLRPRTDTDLVKLSEIIGAAVAGLCPQYMPKVVSHLN